MRGACAMSIAALACAAAQAQVQTQAPEAEGARMQNGGTFYPPPEDVDPMFLPRSRKAQPPDRVEEEDSRTPLELRLSLDVPLRSSHALGLGSQGARGASPTLQADLRWMPARDPGWFLRVVFNRYLRPGEQEPWNPDYFYSFGYEDFRPGRWSLTYSNYTGTRWHPDAALHEGRLNFDEGVWSLAYRFSPDGRLKDVFLAGDGDHALCRASVDWSPRFVDIASASLGRNRTAATLGCRYTRPEGWFADVTFYAYPGRGKQQPWDPDFTYSLGWWDTRPGTLSVQYGNYSGNRFPVRARAPGEGSLRSGSVTLSWRIDW